MPVRQEKKRQKILWSLHMFSIKKITYIGLLKQKTSYIVTQIFHTRKTCHSSLIDILPFLGLLQTDDILWVFCRQKAINRFPIDRTLTLYISSIGLPNKGTEKQNSFYAYTSFIEKNLLQALYGRNTFYIPSSHKRLSKG